MTETVITVQGTARAEYAPERGILSFTIAADGPDSLNAAMAATIGLYELRNRMAANV